MKYTLSLIPTVLSHIQTVLSHTWLLTPQARHNGLCIPAVDLNTNCCANKPSNPTTIYTRGQIVRTEWGRNNHVGGFIRYSIVPLINSDIPNIFNNDSNVFQYNCYAPQCVGNNNNFYAPDPPGTGFNQNKCFMNIKIPDWLPDGSYTMQWRWHGGGDNYNQRNLGLRDFISCHDFRIAGGPLLQRPQCPLFIGGDASNPNLNACEFFKDNDINTCIIERDCFSWYAKAPPKTIMNCPTNILPGGMNNALKGTFLPGTSLPLYVGPSTQTHTNPGNQIVNLNNINQQLKTIQRTQSTPKQYTNTQNTNTQNTNTQNTNIPSIPNTQNIQKCKDSTIIFINNTIQITCSIN
jgi:hypothetical protein